MRDTEEYYWEDFYEKVIKKRGPHKIREKRAGFDWWVILPVVLLVLWAVANG